MAKVLGFDPYARAKRLHPSMLRHPSMQPAPEAADDEPTLATVHELRFAHPVDDTAATAAR